MLSLLAHRGGPHAGLWLHWSLEPAVLAGGFAAAWSYRRGRRRHAPDTAQRGAFWAGMAAVAVALVSPLDLMAAELASAHMVQHVLLVAVAAPLLAWSAPVRTMVRGQPASFRLPLQVVHRTLRRQPLLVALRRPGVAWFLHAAMLWFWHASGPYDAALEHELVHAAEHAGFLLTAIGFWSAIVRGRGARRVSDGFAVLLVFTMGMQGVFLAALLTFATSAWYGGYATTTGAWGLDPLADQQLAGAIMWVPGGLVYVAIGIALMARWLRTSGGVNGEDGADGDWGAASAGASRGLSRP